jgi:threonine/homoserine/homoserine lactone efflux protein
MPAFSTIALFLTLLPGPAVFYILTRSATQGRRAGMASVAGIGLGSLTHAIAATLGLSALLLTSALAFSIVKYLGAAYLIYLGVRTLVTKNKDAQTPLPESQSFLRLFSQGYLVQLLNPKTALFFYAFLPQFVDPARSAVTGQVLFFGLLLVLLALCTDTLYALLGSTMGGWLTRNARFRSIQRYVTGGIYLVLGVAAAITGSGKK